MAFHPGLGFGVVESEDAKAIWSPGEGGAIAVDGVRFLQQKNKPLCFLSFSTSIYCSFSESVYCGPICSMAANFSLFRMFPFL